MLVSLYSELLINTVRPQPTWQVWNKADMSRLSTVLTKGAAIASMSCHYIFVTVTTVIDWQ